MFHPIGENARVQRFRELLQGEITESALCEMGELMYAAHKSYSACGIGSDGTDLLVELVRERGPQSGLYGAKITGGGSGGTVAILGRAGADAAVEEVAREYTRQQWPRDLSFSRIVARRMGNRRDGSYNIAIEGKRICVSWSQAERATSVRTRRSYWPRAATTW